MRMTRRRRSWNDDRRGVRGFALWIGIAQMSREGSEWVRQDVLVGLGRRVLVRERRINNTNGLDIMFFEEEEEEEISFYSNKGEE